MRKRETRRSLRQKRCQGKSNLTYKLPKPHLTSLRLAPSAFQDIVTDSGGVSDTGLQATLAHRQSAEGARFTETCSKTKRNKVAADFGTEVRTK
jgi:hypothetical protein